LESPIHSVELRERVLEHRDDGLSGVARGDGLAAEWPLLDNVVTPELVSYRIEAVAPNSAAATSGILQAACASVVYAISDHVTWRQTLWRCRENGTKGGST